MKGVNILKHGKRPTLAQKIFIESQSLNSEEWLVTKDTTEFMEVVHRKTKETKPLDKKGVRSK